MLAKRIIPCLDVKKGRVVKGINFLELRDAGDPVEQAKIYDEQGADELVFLDITASHEGRQTMVDVVNKTAAECFMPLTVGGGINSVADMRELLQAGADKVSINTSAILNPQIIKSGAEKFGSQCIVVAIDARHREKNTKVNVEEAHEIDFKWDITPVAVDENTVWEVFIHGGRTHTGIDVLNWVKHIENLGAGEILLTSMDADGTKAGYDNELLAIVNETVSIPVIASGGAGTLEHLYDGFVKGKADAVLAASIFHFKEFTIAEAKNYLSEKGIVIRNS